MISEDLKWKKQTEAAVSKANRVLGMLKRTFVSRDMDLWRNLYVSLVRPHLEYAIQVWKPNLVGDVSRIEAVQRRETKISPCLKNFNYEERLRRMRLTSLSDRRIRGDLIEMFKVVNGIDKINWIRKPIFRNDENHSGPASSVRGPIHRFRRVF